MALSITHAKTDNISDWTQADLNAQIALGNYPVGTVLADIVLPSDWNANHTFAGRLPFSNLEQIGPMSVLGVSGTLTADVARIGPGAKGQILKVNSAGTVVEFDEFDLSNTDSLTGTLDIAYIGSGFVKVNGSTPLTGAWAANNDITGITQLAVDNININGNTIISTDTNGNILLTPNGTGNVRLGTTSNYVNIASSTGIITLVGSAEYRIATNTKAFASAAAPNAGLGFTNIGGNRFNFTDTTGADLFAFGINYSTYALYGYSTVSVSPAQITADQNNYNGIGQKGEARLDLDAEHTITGLTAPTNAWEKHLTVWNISAFNAIFTHEDTNSSAINRFLLPNASSLIVGPNQGIEFWWDGVTQRWRGYLIGGAQGPTILSTITGINAKSTGTTTLYTVPTGKTAIITQATVRCTAATSITVGPTLGIGVAAGEDDIFASTAITALTTAGKTFGFSAVGMSVSAAAGAAIKTGIDVASTGTSQTIAIDLLGYLL